MIDIILTREKSYTGGNKFLEIMKGDGPFSYLQFREGSGYTVFEISDSEVNELTEKLISQSWRKKANEIIAKLSLEAYVERNTKSDGTRYKKPKPYEIPAVAQSLVEILGMHDEKEAEKRAKAIFLKLAVIPGSVND